MRRSFSAFTPLLSSIVILLTSAVALAQTVAGPWPRPVTPAMEQKVDAMLRKLTLQEKIKLIGGEDHMFTRPLPSIGVPRLKMSDGPMGVKTWGPSTAYPAGIGLAASWDTSLAREIGTAIGHDARARGVNFLLGPGVNIYRAPMNGRNFEYFGEDPYLAGQIAAGYINGVQSQRVSATVKHFALNNSEFDREHADAIVDERALREIYLPAFEAAVKQGHVGAIMDSYNLVGGKHSAQNKFLNIQVLRKDWGFPGIVMSDWGGAYDGIAAANGGLDLEMPTAEYMNAKTLLPAIESGKVAEAMIDRKVRHILRTAIQFGFLDRNQLDLSVPLYNRHGSGVALQAAEESAVLLKNEGRLLPLDRHAVHTIAVLGPNAYPAVPTAGGSGSVSAFAPVSFMTGLSDALYPGTRVYWNSGIQSPTEIFRKSKWCVDSACQKVGLRRDEYSLATNARLRSVIDRTAIVENTENESDKTMRFEWSGYFVPKTDGVYRFVSVAYHGARYRVAVDGKQVLHTDQVEGGDPKSAQVTLKGGQAVKVHFAYWPREDRHGVGFGVIAEDRLIDPEAIELAKNSDIVVLSVGFNPATESEGTDRTYRLPLGQEKLIAAISAANPRTIVVLTSGGSVATQNWIGKVPVLLQTWYAGQQAGNALPKILFGDVNPSGKLPISWEEKIEDNPTYKTYYELPGTHMVKYSEGVFLGYRHYETSKVKPLFPFGFGLSYTSFAFSDLSVSPSTASPDGLITVGFDVRNTGSHAGAEVAQIYVGDPSATVRRPKMELKGFSRVMLKPGETQHVTATLDKRSLAYWDVKTHGWKVDPGKFIVYVGDSSENVPLQRSFTVQ